MSSEKLNNPLQATTVILDDYGRRSEADATERKAVVAQLENVLRKFSGYETIEWFNYKVHIKEGSSLHSIHSPGALLLKELLKEPNVYDALRKNGISNADGAVYVTASGRMVIHTPLAFCDLVYEGYFDYAKRATVKLNLITEFAQIAGGEISLDSTVTADQWLRCHQLDVPLNEFQVRNLIGHLEFDPVIDHSGTHWEYLDPDSPSQITLSAEQCAAIRQVTARLLGTGKKLLDALHEGTGIRRPKRNDLETLDGCISGLLLHQFSRDLATKYIKELAWFGAQPNEEVSSKELRQLLVTALLLDISPRVGEPQPRNCFGGFDLYAPGHVLRPASFVREQMQAFLIEKLGGKATNAVVSAHLLLAGIAPELLVRGTPESLLVGSVDWLTFCRAVVLAESVRKGASRVSSYEEIMAYAQLEPLTKEQATFRDLAIIDPLVDWALINGVVTTAQLAQAEKETTELAISTFQAYAEKFSPPVIGPLPSRRLIAKEMLQIAAPTCDFLEEKILSHRPGTGNTVLKSSMVELHMSGDLVGGEWDRRAVFPDDPYAAYPDLQAGVTNQKTPKLHDPSVKSIYEEFRRLKRLPSCHNEFHGQLRKYFDNVNNSLIQTVKLAISCMPYDDRRLFLSMRVAFFTFRSTIVEMSRVPTDATSAVVSEYETREAKDAATGRFGLAMLTAKDGKIICYELFTLRGELVKNNALGQSLFDRGIFETESRIDFKGDMRFRDKPVPLQEWKINFKKYCHGDTPDSHRDPGMAVAEKLGELPAANNSVEIPRSPYHAFNNPQLCRLAEFIVKHHSVIGFSELLRASDDPTELELERTKGHKIAEYIVNLVVPFKKCIEDLTSGDSNKVVDGVYGCVMDAIALGGAIFGAGSKALSISAKAISTVGKAGRLAKLAVATSVSLFNPVDGVPTALFGVGKFTHKGLVRFKRQTLDALESAASQLRTLHGVERVSRLSRTADSLRLARGTWRSGGTAGKPVVVMAARKKAGWYALNRAGTPWGPKLNGFKAAAPALFPRIQKTLPTLFTRQFVEKGLSRAKVKIESAFTVLGKEFTAQTPEIIKILFGSDAKTAFNRIQDYLRLIRADFAGYSMSNILLDPLKDTDNLAALDLTAYDDWKKVGGSSNSQFIIINTVNYNEKFVRLGLNHDVVADDLIHEMFHTRTRTADVSYGVEAGQDTGGGQLLDVAPLLNLAAGRLPLSDESTACHPASKALENADSLAIAISLLSQFATDKVMYETNVSIMRTVLNASRGNALDQPVLITLNNPL